MPQEVHILGRPAHEGAGGVHAISSSSVLGLLLSWRAVFSSLGIPCGSTQQVICSGWNPSQTAWGLKEGLIPWLSD